MDTVNAWNEPDNDVKLLSLNPERRMPAVSTRAGNNPLVLSKLEQEEISTVPVEFASFANDALFNVFRLELDRSLMPAHFASNGNALSM